MQVTLEHLSKAYGTVPVLKEISLDIHPGQIVALLGTNGAGKTTLLRCLGGAAQPDHGRILYDGEEFHRGRLDLRRRFAFLPDTTFVHPQMTPLRHIGIVLRLYEADRPGVEERVLELLRGFDLLAIGEARLGTLSRGQVYKTALAALIAANPEVWLLDEPFASGMDPHGMTTFKELARSAAAEGRTILYSTQILEVAERFCDQVCILHRGTIQAFAPVANLRQRAGTEAVLEEVFAYLHEADR